MRPINTRSFLLKVLFCALLICVFSHISNAQFLFEDATDASKINQSVTHTSEIGAGVVVVDLNNDGWDDLYLPGGITADKLYLNQQDGTFLDVTDAEFAKHGNFKSFTHGGTALDFNNDGLADIFMACRRKDLLWKNNGNRTFMNYSQPGNIVIPFEENVSNSVTYGDFDGDGDNDIYVGRWVKEMDTILDSNGHSYFLPVGFENQLYVNTGMVNGTFNELAAQYKVNDDGSTNNVIFIDFDMDGDLDIFVGNDHGMFTEPNVVYQNQLAQTGVVSFYEISSEIGMNNRLYCMTMTPTDYDKDGDFDFYQTSIGNEFLYRNDNGIFRNVAQEIGFPEKDIIGDTIPPKTMWTALFEDFDNDGREDAFIVHGFVHAIVGDLKAQEYDTSRFYYQLADTTFIDVTGSNGIVTDIIGRGAAALDYDRDGRLDIVMGSLGRTPGVNTKDYRVFRNVTPTSPDRNWLQIQCKATTTAKEAIGTTVEVWCNGILHLKQVTTGGGFASSGSLIQHFGLGTALIVDSVILRWPMSKSMHRQVDRYYNVPVNQRITYTEQPKSSVDIATKTISGFSLFPTVADSKVTIAGAMQGEYSYYEIVTPLGITVAKYQGKKNEVELPISMLPSGQYFVKITTNNRSVLQKFVKIAR